MYSNIAYLGFVRGGGSKIRDLPIMVLYVSTLPLPGDISNHSAHPEATALINSFRFGMGISSHNIIQHNVMENLFISCLCCSLTGSLDNTTAGSELHIAQHGPPHQIVVTTWLTNDVTILPGTTIGHWSCICYVNMLAGRIGIRVSCWRTFLCIYQCYSIKYSSLKCSHHIDHPAEDWYHMDTDNVSMAIGDMMVITNGLCLCIPLWGSDGT